MGFLDRMRRKKDEPVEDVKEQAKDEKTPPERRIKRYTSDGRSVYD